MIEKKKNSPPKKGGKTGRNPKIDPAVYRYTVRFNEVEHNRFLAMFEKSGVYARSVFLKEHFFGRPFKVLKVDKTLVEYCTRLSDFHAQFRAVGLSEELKEWAAKNAVMETGLENDKNQG